jgi:RNA polymerase sigma-70 factor (ECF subfamily)
MRETADARMVAAGLWREPERRRLVQLCAALSGDRDAAEDLAQETLLEAWRNAHKLRDPEGADRWLAAIARNVCLRWGRRRGRDVGVVTGWDDDLAPADDLDVEADLERAELVELLDRALALVPSDTRDVLVQRYVHDAPNAEIAACLGLSEDAVAMRVSRGKVVLRRVLASELRDDAEAHGLVDASEGDWRPTRVWCAECGRRRLLTRREASPGVVSFRCPGCNPGSVGTEYSLTNPLFAELVGEVTRPTAILARAAGWSREYFAPGAGGARVPCTRCGNLLHLRRYTRDRSGHDRAGLYADCDVCGEQVSSSIQGLAQSLPEVQEFRRRHDRTQALPEQPLELEGRPAILVRYEDVLGQAAVNVFFAAETLQVIRAETG